MGYPIEMIDKETALFSLIGESAIESKKEALFNDIYKARDVNAKMMPLNIRMDDIGFFIYGFKDSQIKAAYFQQEYWTRLHDLLEDMSEEAKLCGIVDTIDVIDKTNVAYLTQGKATTALLNPKGKRVAIYGNNASIKSILYHLVKENPSEIIFYDERVENCMELMALVPEGIKVDVERVQEPIMIKDVDIMIDANMDDTVTYHDNIPTILQLHFNESKHLTFNDIEKEIANIKTKEWINNG
jgi:shikimate 5-dehydrogenase